MYVRSFRFRYSNVVWALLVNLLVTFVLLQSVVTFVCSVVGRLETDASLVLNKLSAKQSSRVGVVINCCLNRLRKVLFCV